MTHQAARARVQRHDGASVATAKHVVLDVASDTAASVLLPKQQCRLTSGRGEMRFDATIAPLVTEKSAR